MKPEVGNTTDKAGLPTKKAKTADFSTVVKRRRLLRENFNLIEDNNLMTVWAALGDINAEDNLFVKKDPIVRQINETYYLA